MHQNSLMQLPAAAQNSGSQSRRAGTDFDNSLLLVLCQFLKCSVCSMHEMSQHKHVRQKSEIRNVQCPVVRWFLNEPLRTRQQLVWSRVAFLVNTFDSVKNPTMRDVHKTTDTKWLLWKRWTEPRKNKGPLWKVARRVLWLEANNERCKMWCKIRFMQAERISITHYLISTKTVKSTQMRHKQSLTNMHIEVKSAVAHLLNGETSWKRNNSKFCVMFFS